MKIKTSYFVTVLALFAILLEACSGPIAVVPTATETATPLPTSTSTSTVTPLPTETAVPQPASLSGTIYLSNNSFVSSVELRQGENFTLMANGPTDANGSYKIENIEPGIYALWVLITTESAVISGCNDIAPPDDAWKIGIRFAGDMALTMEHAYLSKGLLLVENMQSSDLKAEGFYAVLDGFEITSGIENKFDVALICK